MFRVHQASTDADWRDATALLHDYVDWVRGWTGFDPVAEQPQLNLELAHPADQFAASAPLFVASWESIAVGMVAIRVQDDGSAELKRMYVRPIARGRGVADALIDAAIGGAVERRCAVVWLETLPGAMNPAISAYRRNGFAESPSRRPTLRMDGAIVMERTLGQASRCA